jgi:hypothetical protein
MPPINIRRNIKKSITKNVKIMQRISLYAPNEPKNEIIATITPAAISIEAEATYHLTQKVINTSNLY